MAEPDVTKTLTTLRKDLEKQIEAAQNRRTSYAQLAEDSATEVTLLVPELDMVRVLWNAAGMEWDPKTEDGEKEPSDG